MTEREEKILDFIENFKYVERSMITDRFFKFKSGAEKCQQVMAKLHKHKLIERFKPGSRNEYIYYIGKRSQKWRHWLELNRFHFSITDLHSWQKVIFYDHEIKYSHGVADGLYIFKTTIEGNGLIFWLEVDDGGNKFEKVQQYLAAEKAGHWQSEWWAQYGWPLVVIVTPRRQEIQAMVENLGADRKFVVLSKKKEYSLKEIGKESKKKLHRIC